MFDLPTVNLGYYDRIGVLKPVEIDGETKYRYYSEEQLVLLHDILLFRSMDIPIQTIKEWQSKTDIQDKLEILNAQREPL